MHCRDCFKFWRLLMGRMPRLTRNKWTSKSIVMVRNMLKKGNKGSQYFGQKVQHSNEAVINHYKIVKRQRPWTRCPQHSLWLQALLSHAPMLFLELMVQHHDHLWLGAAASGWSGAIWMGFALAAMSRPYHHHTASYHR